MITLPSINDSSINTQEVRLHFYHCIECLFKVSNPKDFRSHGKYSDRTNLECGICSSDMEYQGQATSDTKRIQKFGLASACNAKCTEACGPLCNCPCMGLNHGTGKMREVVYTTGKPRVSIERSDNYFQEHWTIFKKHVYLMDQWRQAFAFRRSNPISGKYFYSYREQEVFNKANKAKNAGNREDILIGSIQVILDNFAWQPDYPDTTLGRESEIDWRSEQTIPEDHYMF